MTRFDQEKIDGFDHDWYVTDSMGEIAHYITAGLGEIPESVLRSLENNNKLIDHFNSLPILSNSVVKNSEIKEVNSLPKDYKMFAESSLKGLHVCDALIKPGGRGKKYFKIFSPVKPLTIANLPNDIREMLRLTTLHSGLFVSSEEILSGEYSLSFRKVGWS